MAHLVVVRNDGVDGACFPIEVRRKFSGVCVPARTTSPLCTPPTQSGEEISLGRDVQCDVRIRLPAVSRVHCRIIARDDKVRCLPMLGACPTRRCEHSPVPRSRQVWLINVSKTGKTQVNGETIVEPTLMFHKDEFTVATRNFRIRYEPGFEEFEEVRPSSPTILRCPASSTRPIHSTIPLADPCARGRAPNAEREHLVQWGRQ